MKVTIKAQTLADFHRPELHIFFRVYALNYFINQSDGKIVQPGGPFYYEWPCTKAGNDLVIPELQLESTIDALNPAHPEGLRYFAGFYDQGGNPITPFWPKPVFSLDANPNPTYWAAIHAYNSAGVEFDWTTTHEDHYSKEEFDELLENPPPPEPGQIRVQPPLVFDGSTLSIPRASAIQNGYLSHNDFILFSGESAVAVTSFNLRTGEVVLIPEDVWDALGYHPLDPRGDTMTGPLTLAANPTSALEAATRQYVDAAGAGLPDTYILSAFGTSGSKVRFTGTISAGALTILTLSAPSDFVVGQGILIKGAGSNAGIPGAHLTKVDAIDSTLQIITLHDAASGAVIAVTDNVQHDETVAIQAAINTVCAALGGKIAPEKGYYRINGPINPATNSILAPPFLSASTNTFKLLAFESPFAPAGAIGGYSQDAVIFHTEASGPTGCSIFAGNLWNPDTSSFSSITAWTIVMKGLMWQVPSNPQISAVDLGMFANCILKQCHILNVDQYPDFVKPTHPGTFGLRLPRGSNPTAYVHTENVLVGGFDTAIIASEMWMAGGMTSAQLSNVGVDFQGGNFIDCGRLLIYYCPTGVKFSGPTAVDLLLDWEKPGSGPFLGSVDIADPSDVARGSIKYRAVQTGTGPVSVVTTGLSKCLLHNLMNGDIAMPGNVGVPGGVTAGGDLHVAGDTMLDGDLVASGLTRLSDGMATYPLSAGANSSATESGFREIRFPNAGAVGILTKCLHYWKLEETADPRFDSVASNHLAMVYNAVSAIAGKIGSGGDYPGQTIYGLVTPDSPAFDFSARSITITGWINLHGLTAYSTLLARFDTGLWEFGIFFHAGDGKFHAQLSNNGTGVTHTLILPDTIAINTWYFLALSIDIGAAHLASLSLNAGTPVTAAFTGSMPHTASKVFTGFIQLSGASALSDCATDEIGIFDLLTPTEISTLYGGGTAPLTYPF